MKYCGSGSDFYNKMVAYIPDSSLTHWPLGDLDAILKLQFSILFYWLVPSHHLIIMPWGECHETSPRISQHWLVQVPSHNLSQCCLRSMSPYGVTRPQWVLPRRMAFAVYPIKHARGFVAHCFIALIYQIYSYNMSARLLITGNHRIAPAPEMYVKLFVHNHSNAEQSTNNELVMHCAERSNYTIPQTIRLEPMRHWSQRMSISPIDHYITVTSKWARWRLKSPASPLFTQTFIQAQIKENIKAPRHFSSGGEFIGHRLIPRTKTNNAGNVSIWWRHLDVELLLSNKKSCADTGFSGRLLAICIIPVMIKTQKTDL